VRTADEALLRLEMRVGRLLQAGVISSAVCLAVGLVYWMMRGPSPASDAALTTGLIVLMATPIVRVLISLIAYVRMRDWFFVVTTVMVFVLLAVTIALALMKAGAD
jgi:uncharacterized membrane protein